MDPDTLKTWLAVAAFLALPVSAISKIVTLASSVKSNKEEVDRAILETRAHADAAIAETRAQAVAAMAAHERLCEERMRSLLQGNQLLLEGLRRVEQRVGSM